jgi:hypothetical protein
LLSFFVVFLSVSLSLCLTVLLSSAFLPFCLSVSLSLCLSLSLSVSLSPCLPVSLSLCLSVSLSLCLSVSLSLYLLIKTEISGDLNITDEPFYLMASRLKNSYFSFESVMVVDYYLTGINFSPDDDDSNFECITAVFNQYTSRLDIYPTDCQEKHTIVCRKVMLL